MSIILSRVNLESILSYIDALSMVENSVAPGVIPVYANDESGAYLGDIGCFNDGEGYSFRTAQ